MLLSGSVPSRAFFAASTSSSKGLSMVGYLVEMMQPSLFRIVSWPERMASTA